MLGQTISHYQIKRELGRGGMGVVYLAEDLRLGRQVAIKALPADVSRDPVRRKRFEQEARACAALNHAAIAAVFDLEVSGEDLFIIFEYVDGDDLRALLRRQPLETSVLLRFARGIARGLAAAHQAGIVHRDLKPENIRINSAGEVKILDFGLARMQTLFTNDATMSLALTSQGTIVGTVGYMSPEQLESRELDPRSDIFSLGVILYEMAAGVHPFQGESPASTIANVLAREPAPIAHLNPVQPPALDTVVRKCLAKKKDERYQSAAELLVDLEDLQRGSGDSMKTVVLAPKTAAAPAVDQDSVLARSFSRLLPNVRSWWEIHHIFLAVGVLGLFPALAWQMRGGLGGQLDVFFFFTVVIFTMIHFVFRAGMVLAVLFHRARQAETIQNLGPVVRLTHILLCFSVLFAAPKFVVDHPLLGTVFAGIVIGGILVSLAIEPWMESNAFPQLAQLREELRQKDEASPTRGARRWWLTHHLSSMFGWTPMTVALPWMVRGWLPQADNISDFIVFLCILLALQNFGLRAYVLEVAWFHREALETTVRKMATPLLICNLLLASLCAAISLLLFKTHLPQAIGFMVMAVGAAMIVGILERNFNRYAFPGLAADPDSDDASGRSFTALAIMQVPYIFSNAYLLVGMLRKVDEVQKWLSADPRPMDLYVFGGFTLLSLVSLLFLGTLMYGLLQRRMDVVQTFRRWFLLFTLIYLFSQQGAMLFLARNTNLFILLIGATALLYGIRYQWILAKRILPAAPAENPRKVAEWNDQSRLTLLLGLYGLSASWASLNSARRAQQFIQWLTTPQGDKTPMTEGVMFILTSVAALFLFVMVYHLLRGRPGVVAFLKRAFVFFAVLEFVALGGIVDLLDRYTNLMVLSIGIGAGLYGIRYQWILAKRILQTEATKAEAAAGKGNG